MQEIYGNVILFCGSPAILDLEYGNRHVQVEGETVQEARKQPLDAERVKKQMEKTGNTPFVFEHLDVQTDEQGFLPMQSLNELRRKGLEALEKSACSPSDACWMYGGWMAGRRKHPQNRKKAGGPKSFTCLWRHGNKWRSLETAGSGWYLLQHIHVLGR